MLKISKKVEYSLMILKHFLDYGENQQCTARMICERYKIPFDTTSKVMQIMNNHHILASHQGVKGGYKLNMDLSSLTYLDFLKIIEGKDFQRLCTKDACSLVETCNIIGPIDKLNQYLYLFFENLNVQSLLQQNMIDGLTQIKTEANI